MSERSERTIDTSERSERTSDTSERSEPTIDTSERSERAIDTSAERARAMAHAAADKLGTGTVNLPNNHPAQVAAMVAMVDHMLEGRFMFGIGPGGLRSDMEMRGNLERDRNAMFVEANNQISRWWRGKAPNSARGPVRHMTHTEARRRGGGGMSKKERGGPGRDVSGRHKAALLARPGEEGELVGVLTEAMVRFAARNEYARTVEDVLARRSRLLFLDARLAESLAPGVSKLIQEETGVDPMLSDFLALCEQYLHLPD
mgnify:CR=1 FL=1